MVASSSSTEPPAESAPPSRSKKHVSAQPSGRSPGAETASKESQPTSRAAGGVAQVLEVDVRENKQPTNAIDGFAQQLGRLDALVNNAGDGYWQRVAEADPDEWRKEVEINLSAPMYASRAALDHMIRADSGHTHSRVQSTCASRTSNSSHRRPRRPSRQGMPVSAKSTRPSLQISEVADRPVALVG